MLVWGSSFILIKRSLEFFSASEVGLLRVVITFLFMLPIALVHIGKLNNKHKKYLIISGVIGSLIPAFMFAIAQTRISSLMAGTLNSLTPLFTLFLGLAFFNIRASWYNIIGVAIGLVGAVGLIYASSGNQNLATNFSYSALIIIASICYAFNINFIKRYLKQINSLTITAVTFFYIGIPSLIYLLLFSDIPHKIIHQGNILHGLFYVGTLSVFGTGIALIAFNRLIKMSSPIFASSITYVIPIVAIIWGIIDGEIFKASYIAWFVLILIGVLLVNTSDKSKLYKTITNRLKQITSRSF